MQTQWMLINNVALSLSLARVLEAQLFTSPSRSRARFGCAFFFHACLAAGLCMFLLSVCFDLSLKRICSSAYVYSCRMLVQNNFFSQLTALLSPALDYQASDLFLQLICSIRAHVLQHLNGLI